MDDNIRPCKISHAWELTNWLICTGDGMAKTKYLDMGIYNYIIYIN